MIIYKYILKAHFLPFIFSVFILMSVFLLQFFMKFADRLIGKGLSIIIITKLIVYNLAWMLVLVVPMAVLVATLMAFGSMSQNNEVAILKATGVSLYKMLIPPFFASILIALLLVQFNNYVYPNANHAARVLAQDISKKKPTLSLVPGVFSQDVSKYSILVRKIDDKTNELEQITIYDNTDTRYTNVITAIRGKLYFSKNEDKLIMDLWNGEIHTSEMNNQKPYRRVVFKKHKIVMNADNFSFKESTPGSKTRGDREMGAQTMLLIVDSLNVLRNDYNLELQKSLESYLTTDTAYIANPSFLKTKGNGLIFRKVTDHVRTSRSVINSNVRKLTYNQKSINKYWVEIHKKYSLPVACIIFILIGAPLGTMTRKGGFGVAGAISLIFFLIYWAFLIGGEKLADRGLLSPFWGMWGANIVLGILGIYLTIKSAKERVTLNFDSLLKLIPKRFRTFDEQNENN
ncbi:MAG: YjgP/YjgQ family permease [Ignavibacteriae bacterium HGW-Ignavibacteriae-2]|nr:MAG: YjgP/YjgQ family permease [Ignavibacteriae bacterium HGW-Ignavibacteriae-2]